MKNKFIHRTAAGLLALTIVAGASSALVTANAAEAPITLISANPSASTLSFDAETGTLTLSGNLNKQELINFKDYEKATTIVAEEGTVLPADSHNLFYGFIRTVSIDLSKADTSAVTDMSGMFFNCFNMVSLDISSFNTSNVTDMSNMFRDCSKLTEIDVTNFDTSNVTDMSHMFANCALIESLDLTGFNTSKVTSMHNMFGSCHHLTSLDLSSFDTSNVTEMHYMFDHCSRLESIDLSSFDTSSAENMERMFNTCSLLKSLDLSGFSTEKAANVLYMFNNCRSLTELTLARDIKNITKDMCLRNEQGHGWINANDPATVVSGTGKYAEFENSGRNTYLYANSTSMITGASLTLDGSIGINFHVALSDKLTADQKAKAYIIFSGSCDENDKKVTVWKNKAVCHVSAKNMADKITATLYINDKAIDTKSISVKDYADAILSDPRNYEAEQDIVKAMLNYGGKAQKLFGYSVNSTVDTSIEYTGTDFSYAPTFTEPAAIEGLSYYGSSLVLKSKTTLRHYFKLTSGKINDYTFICSGEALFPQRYNDTDYYYVDNKEINAADLESNYTITVRKGKERMTFKYGPMDYIKHVLTGEEEQPQALKDAVLALYWYNKAAVAYMTK